MKCPILLTITLFFIAPSLNAQTEPPQWQVGLHAAPIFTTARNYNGFTGFTVYPGIYRSHNRITYGFMPYYSRSSFSYNTFPYDEENKREYTFNVYGGTFQFRYHLGSGRIRPYVLAQAGFGYFREKFETTEPNGESYEKSYWNLHSGIGFGVDYKLNNNWSLDANVRVDLLFGPETINSMVGSSSFGIFRRIGK